jgi:hypothetical protein
LRDADEKIASLTQIIHQFNANNKLKGKKPLKPFYSTVRANSQFPEVLSNDLNEKCNCYTGRKTNISKKIEKLQNDLKHADLIIKVLMKQEEEKDREIERLHCLFFGGSPFSALAKDCCLKNYWRCWNVTKR